MTSETHRYALHIAGLGWAIEYYLEGSFRPTYPSPLPVKDIF